MTYATTQIRATDEIRKLTSTEYKIVTEDELDEYLKDGWEPVNNLRDNRVVVKRSPVISRR